MAAITFGANTCFAVKRWPEPEAWSRVVREAGVATVQFSYDLLDPLMVGENRQPWAHVREVCDDAGVTISSAFTGFVAYAQNFLGHPDGGLRHRAEEWFRLAIDAAAVLGARGAGGHMGAMSVSEYADPAARARSVARTIDAVLRLSEHAARKGLEFLLWEVMPVAREYPARITEAEELGAGLEGSAIPVQLCLDLGHACLSGASEQERDPYYWLERVGHMARAVHLQQTDGEYDRHWPFTEAFNAQGIVSPQRVMNILSGLPQPEIEVMLECIHPFEASDESVKADLQASIEYWRPWLSPSHNDARATGVAERTQ